MERIKTVQSSLWAPAWREMGPHQEDRLLRTRRRPCGEGLMRDADKVHATATDAQWGRRERYC